MVRKSSAATVTPATTVATLNSSVLRFGSRVRLAGSSVASGASKAGRSIGDGLIGSDLAPCETSGPSFAALSLNRSGVCSSSGLSGLIESCSPKLLIGFPLSSQSSCSRCALLEHTNLETNANQHRRYDDDRQINRKPPRNAHRRFGHWPSYNPCLNDVVGMAWFTIHQTGLEVRRGVSTGRASSGQP